MLKMEKGGTDPRWDPLATLLKTGAGMARTTRRLEAIRKISRARVLLAGFRRSMARLGNVHAATRLDPKTGVRRFPWHARTGTRGGMSFPA
jgi:hypothetical protein